MPSHAQELALQPLTVEDAAALFRWRTNPVVSRYLPSAPPPLEDFAQWINESASGERWTLRGIALDGQLIGYVSTEQVDPIARMAQVGILIGKPNLWGRGFARRALVLLLNHAFQIRGLQGVTALIASENERSIRLFESAGFALEGVREERSPIDGTRTDLLRYVLSRSE